MTDERIDFSALDPMEDQLGFERMVRSITEDAADELAARRARYNVIGQVVTWWRPMLAAATVLVIASVAALTTVDATPSTVDPSTGIAQAIGVPSRFAQWVASDELPTTSDLLQNLGENQ